MVKECSDKYDSKRWIYMEYMDEDGMNKSKYIYSDNEESKYSNGMLRDNIKIRSGRCNSTSECKYKYDSRIKIMKSGSDIELYRWSMSNIILLVNK